MDHTRTTWTHGNTTVLATNKMVYNEAISVLYGCNTFAVNVVWQFVTFAYQFILPDGLMSLRNLAFPKFLAARNVALIRKLVIRVHHVAEFPYRGNDYTTRLKYRVDELCKDLGAIPEIAQMHVHVQNDNSCPDLSHVFIGSFLALRNIRDLTISPSSEYERACAHRLNPKPLCHCSCEKGLAIKTKIPIPVMEADIICVPSMYEQLLSP